MTSPKWKSSLIAENGDDDGDLEDIAMAEYKKEAGDSR